MPKKQIQIEVESSGYDILAHLAKIVAAVKQAGAFTVAQIPTDVATLVAELPAIVSAAQSVSGDLKEDEAEFIRGAENGAWEVLHALKNQPVVAQ